jgi:hypothetical protein
LLFIPKAGVSTVSPPAHNAHFNFL